MLSKRKRSPWYKHQSETVNVKGKTFILQWTPFIQKRKLNHITLFKWWELYAICRIWLQNQHTFTIKWAVSRTVQNHPAHFCLWLASIHLESIQSDQSKWTQFYWTVNRPIETYVLLFGQQISSIHIIFFTVLYF